MSPIENEFSSINSYQEMKKFIADLSTDIHWWGGRYVYKIGKEGSLPLLTVAHKAFYLQNQLYDIKDQKRFYENSLGVNKLVKLNDDLFNKKNYITQLFCRFINQCNCIYYALHPGFNLEVQLFFRKPPYPEQAFW